MNYEGIFINTIVILMATLVGCIVGAYVWRVCKNFNKSIENGHSEDE
jgi:urea transporter